MEAYCKYNENGEEKWFDHGAYVNELKENHYRDLKVLIKKAMGIRTQVEFAADINMSKEYLNRILKEDSDIVPSNKMLRSISKNSSDKDVTLKELLIAAGRTPACEKLDTTRNTPNTILVDNLTLNDVYSFKKNLVELFIRERGTVTEYSPKEYLENLLDEFITECVYSFFDLECFVNVNEDSYNTFDDWARDIRFGIARHENNTDVVLMGIVTAAVRTKFDPDEWVKSAVSFAFFFEKNENGSLTVIDTDWDIPEWAMDQPALEKVEITGAYPLKDFLDEVDEPAYTIIPD